MGRLLVGKKAKNNPASTAGEHNENIQQKKVENTMPPSHAQDQSGDSVSDQSESDREDSNPSTSQAKCKKRKSKKKKQTTSISSTRNDPVDMSNGVNRGFRYLLQPVVFESVRIPREDSDNPSVTNDVRELLRLIDLNPSLATCITELIYHESHPDENKPLQHSMKELKSDHKIFSKLVQEVDLKTSTGRTFHYPLNPSGLRGMSKLYEHMCTPLLLSRLTNLGMLIFHGYVGGPYAYLLTRWASHIWTRMQLRSLKTLVWRSKENDEDYQRMQLPVHRAFRYQTSTTPEKPHSNEWNVLSSFLRFTPTLRELIFLGDTFVGRSTPQNMPILNSLTSICIHTEYFKETSQLLFELLKCSPLLKSLETCHFDVFKASKMRETLNIVRNTIEEIHILGSFEGTSSTDAAIGPFLDFSRAPYHNNNLASLIPVSPTGRPEDSCLLRILPANLECLHLYLYDPHDLPSPSAQSNNDDQQQYELLPDLIRRPYGWLEKVALAKESGSLKKLCLLSIEDKCWKLFSNKTRDEGPKTLAAICARLGIEWEWSGGDDTDSGEMESDSDTDWETGSAMSL
ncbi:hypothetical protein BZA77DRAFT_291877 [Pyronema omphalodes]|nr:hypothetical protein BZA77DRAFT_296894 [Pyronema omphalodes]KAI5817948.1 hypothetical protein BZA77DRAFT_291877 [Pyronema omphalodes]